MEAIALRAVDLDDGFHLVEIDVGLDPWPHRLESVGIFRAPKPAIGLLPRPFADIIADGVAEHAGHRVGLRQMLCLLADDDDQLALVVDLLGSGCRDHDIFVMRDQRVLRAITDLGPIGNIGHFATLVGGFLEMLEVIEADAIERTRHQRQFDFHLRQGMRARCALPLAEGIAADRGYAVTFDDPTRGLSARRKFEPTHAYSLFCYSAATRG